MDYGGGSSYPGSSAIAIIPDASGPPGHDSWPPAGSDQLMWATDEDYRAWGGDLLADTGSNSAYDGRQSQSRAGSEQPPSKRSRNGDSQGGNRNNSSKAIGKMFFKTKLCCKFRAGTCPYITNCNFAHGIEELRKPPPNWQEIVAAHEEGSEPPLPIEERQIPTISSSIVIGESERSYKGRRCKKFYTEEGCPYGDSCTFIHDEQSKARESVAISLSPSVGGGAQYGGGAAAAVQKPSNWKTRICNKWEMTGYCPFGSKCHFAHGAEELHRYGGGLMDTEGRDVSSTPDTKQAGPLAKATTDASLVSNVSVPHADIYHISAPSQRSATALQRQGQRSAEKWKGPDKISKIYGDWIDDIE
ncbi:zinc finger CCCH domain-containing protein 56-like [Zingiber officinale]|uniref:zinc finger CCCH domain-containing protein 56-like n=1 Tax=Zingiber officinale TaxID=94328 RepID=UPI001C4B7B23|nr:zinc finger CCCH domain-containing protein 56-like [Zingiber officinale]